MNATEIHTKNGNVPVQMFHGATTPFALNSKFQSMELVWAKNKANCIIRRDNREWRRMNRHPDYFKSIVITIITDCTETNTS